MLIVVDFVLAHESYGDSLGIFNVGHWNADFVVTSTPSPFVEMDWRASGGQWSFRFIFGWRSVGIFLGLDIELRHGGAAVCFTNLAIEEVGPHWGSRTQLCG